MKRNMRLYTTILILALCILPIAQAKEIAFETIDPPRSPSSIWNHASGINNQGQIVGMYKGEDRLFHGFMAEIALTNSAALSSRSKVSTTWARIKAE